MIYIQDQDDQLEICINRNVEAIAIHGFNK